MKKWRKSVMFDWLSLSLRQIQFLIKMAEINRLKVVLVENKKTSKWLAETLGKDPATVSKWCTNSAQPGLETLIKIAAVLEVDVKDLLHSTTD